MGAMGSGIAAGAQKRRPFWGAVCYGMRAEAMMRVHQCDDASSPER